MDSMFAEEDTNKLSQTEIEGNNDESMNPSFIYEIQELNQKQNYFADIENDNLPHFIG